LATLRNNGAYYRASGRGDALEHWAPGVAKEVTDAQAAYLLAEQPRFSVVAVVQAATPSAPPPKAPSLTNARQIVQDVDLGKHDEVLEAIADKESERSKPRRSILKAVRERLSFLEG
jgi:hypothetical protein